MRNSGKFKKWNNFYLPWSNVDFEYSSKCGPWCFKFDRSIDMLSKLHWPIDTESATFSIIVISSSTKSKIIEYIVKRIWNLKTADMVWGGIAKYYVLVCSSIDVLWCKRFGLPDCFNGRGASKFFNDRLIWDIFRCFDRLSIISYVKSIIR